MRALLLASVLICPAADAGAAAVASGRNWRIAFDSMDCETAGTLLVVGARIDYLGPKGPVEAPVSELIDDGGRVIRPTSLLWKSGDKQLARWLAAGGLANLQSEHVASVQIKFDVRDNMGGLKFLFGDIKPFALSSASASASRRVCDNLLKFAQLQAPRVPPPSAKAAAPNLRVYREAYPCLAPQGQLRSIETNQPPYLPRQLLLLGRGFLPSARQVDLPAGKAPAQTYFYAGADALNPVEDAARLAVAADFPEFRAGMITSPAASSPAKKFFAFNWGAQKSQSGNELYSVGIYDVRPCAR